MGFTKRGDSSNPTDEQTINQLGEKEHYSISRYYSSKDGESRIYNLIILESS